MNNMENNEPNKGDEPPDDIGGSVSEMATAAAPSALPIMNSAERRIARYKDERRRQLATQIANRLSSNRSFSSSSSTSSSEEGQYRGNGKQKRGKRGSLESCSGGSGSLGKLSTETNQSGSACTRSINSNKSYSSSYSKYRRYQRSRRPNQELPPSLPGGTENPATIRSSMTVSQSSSNQSNLVSNASSSAPRRRRRKSFNCDQPHCSPASNASSKQGKSPSSKAQRNKKISAAQLGDADGEDDDYDEEDAGFKNQKAQAKSPISRKQEREKSSPEHIYHQIGSDALIKISKKPSSSYTQKTTTNTVSSSPLRHARKESKNSIPCIGNNEKQNSGPGMNPEIAAKNDRLEKENNEILMKIKEIKSKIKDIKKPTGRTESFNFDVKSSERRSNPSLLSNHSPRSRFLTRAQSFDDKKCSASTTAATENSNDERCSIDDHHNILVSSHPVTSPRKPRKTSLPRGM